MKLAWFVVWAVVVWQVAAWAFAPAAVPPPPSQVLEVNRGKAFGSNEDIAVNDRHGKRQAAFTTLERPWGSRCTGEGRKAFIGGNEYYYHRQNQTERYPETYGQLGADYIARQWSGSDDQRIDRLTQEAYAKGYLKPADFDGVARKMIAKVVKDERVTGKACVG